MSNLEAARNCLSKYKIGVVGQRPMDFLSIRRLVEISVVLACEGDPITLDLQSSALVLSPEFKIPHRAVWTNLSLAVLAEMGRIPLAQIASVTDPLVLLAYAANDDWERLAGQSRGAIRYVAPPAHLKNVIDNKATVRSALQGIGVPVPESALRDSHELDFALLTRELGSRLVLQKLVGSAGIGTYFVDSAEQVELLRGSNPAQTWMISAYAGDMTLNAHGLALDGGIEVSLPSVQITGVTELCSVAATYCGNDFGAIDELSAMVIDTTLVLTERIGHWLVSLGYRGLYGVDFIVDGSSVRVLEINPRLQGSSWLLAELEYEAHQVPLVVKHFLASLGHDPYLNSWTRSGGPASQALLHCKAEKTLRVSHTLEPGVYVLDASGRLCRRRAGLGLLDLADDEFILFGLPPRPSSLVEPGAVLARIGTRARLARGDGRELTPYGRRVCQVVRHAFAETPADQALRFI